MRQRPPRLRSAPAAERAGVPGGARHHVVPADCRPDRRASPGAQADRRPHGRAAREPAASPPIASSPSCWRSPDTPTSRSRRPASPATRKTPYPFRSFHRAPAPRLRRVRADTDVLGHRHHPDALFLAAMRDACSPRSCRGSRAATSTSSWAKPCATGSAGAFPAEGGDRQRTKPCRFSHRRMIESPREADYRSCSHRRSKYSAFMPSQARGAFLEKVTAVLWAVIPPSGRRLKSPRGDAGRAGW